MSKQRVANGDALSGVVWKALKNEGALVLQLLEAGHLGNWIEQSRTGHGHLHLETYCPK